jgi:glycogen synthase
MDKKEIRRIINTWEPMHLVSRPQFGRDELKRLHLAQSRFEEKRRTTAILSLENPFASLGGLGTITRYFPAALKKAGERVIFITPFYHKNVAVLHGVDQTRLRFRHKISIETPAIKLYGKYYEDIEAPVPSYYLHLDKHFSAPLHPYDYQDQKKLLDDSLAFCAAVPFLIAALGVTGDVLFHAQDWETAAIALTGILAVRDNVLRNSRTVLTLHNSFDAELPPSLMRRYFGRLFEGKTILQAAIPFLDAPVTTVSTSFARELTTDPLQRQHFIPHLQLLLRNTAVIGIEHGLFGSGKIAMTKKSIQGALRGNGTALIEEKQLLRAELIEEIGRRHERSVVGALRFPHNQKNVPIFFMMGRLDIMQKGFDVIFQAFTRLKPGSAKLVFSPSLAPGQPADVLGFFQQIALRCAGDITIWPFRLDRDEYRRCVRGASFLVMPSLYEPFGAATEGYMNGTPVIGRATGGLISQVISSVPFGGRMHQPAGSRHATGILFREAYHLPLTGNEWRRLLSTPVNKRTNVPLYQSMVDAAAQALVEAIKVYRNEKEYAKMIASGIGLLGKFRWALSARSYRMMYAGASKNSCF